MPFDGGKREIQLALDLTTIANMYQIERYRLPPLYSTGIRYQRDVCAARGVPGACERFVTAQQCLSEFRAGLKLGFDCDDLAPWRAAELRLAAQGRAPWLGFPGDRQARAVPIVSPDIGWHIIVLGTGGKKEDPSKRLGM